MRVGTRTMCKLRLLVWQDHPHACGDKRNIVLPLRAVIGSSPCVWGQDTVKQTLNSLLRIIPMRVGTRFVKPQPRLARRDHPHACGDKS